MGPDPGWQTSFEAESFNNILDATGYINPCGANGKPKCEIGATNTNANILAHAGAPAQAGDNCTPVNGYSVGYALGNGTPLTPVITPPNAPIIQPNSLTIVDQGSINMINAAGVVTPIGWTLTTAGGAVYFVPNLSTMFGVAVVQAGQLVPSAYPISKNVKTSKQFLNAIRAIIMQVANSIGVPPAPGLTTVTGPSTVQDVGCYTKPLSGS